MIPIKRRYFLATPPTVAVLSILPTYQAHAALGGSASWKIITDVANLVGNICMAINVADKANSWLNDPPATIGADVDRAIAVLAAQPALLDDLRHFRMVVREEINQANLDDLIRKIRARLETDRSFILGMQGSRKAEQAQNRFVDLNDCICSTPNQVVF